MKFQGKVFIVYDGQAGDAGKGKFVGLLAFKKNITVAINNNLSGSDHTFVFDSGEVVMTSQIPMAFVSPKVKYLLIGAGSAVNPEILNAEIEKFKHILGNRKIFVHKRAMIVLPKHIREEKETIKSGSTFRGSGAAAAEKILRKPGVILAKDFSWGEKVKLVDDEFIQNVLCGENGFLGKENILIETSQGFDLDINHGLEYPFVTSRQCVPAQALADSGIPHNVKTETYMIVRPYPIRISNKGPAGEQFSGDYDGGKEISWEEIEKRSGCKNLKENEITGINPDLRRVFEFNDKRFKRAIAITNPNHIILNFAQYIHCDIENKTNKDLRTISNTRGYKIVGNYVKKLENDFHVDIVYIGTGAKLSQFIEVKK